MFKSAKLVSKLKLEISYSENHLLCCSSKRLNMLSDDVLNELLEDSMFQEELVALTWPSISVESKLQFIHASQTDIYPPRTYSFVLDIALEDDAPIVRYWAARYYNFTPEPLIPVERDSGDGYFSSFMEMVDSSLEKAYSRTRKASSDDCELVRVFGEQATILPRLSDISTLTGKTVIIRNKRFGSPGHEWFHWFSSYVQVAVDNEDLSPDISSCISAFAKSQWLAEAIDQASCAQDSELSIILVDMLNDLWGTLAKNNRGISRTIVRELPIRVNEYHVNLLDHIGNDDSYLIDTLAHRDDFYTETLVSSFLTHVADETSGYGERSVDSAQKLLSGLS